MNSPQLLMLANFLSSKIKIPLLNEQIVSLIIVGILAQIDSIIGKRYEGVSLADYVFSDDNGIALDIEEIKADLVTVLNAEINIPVLGEASEARLFDTILSTVAEFAKLGSSVPLK